MKRIAIPVTSLWAVTLLCTSVLAAQKTEIGNGRVVTRDANGVKSIQLGGDGNEPDHVLIGFAGSKPADVELIVVDPSSDFSALEPVFIVDASVGALSLGSGGAELEGEDGEIFVEDGFGNTSFQVEGSTGNAMQVVSGNGLVKGWAKINADGTVHSCWNCNSDPAETGICCDGAALDAVDEVRRTMVRESQRRDVPLLRHMLDVQVVEDDRDPVSSGRRSRSCAVAVSPGAPTATPRTGAR